MSTLGSKIVSQATMVWTAQEFAMELQHLEALQEKRAGTNVLETLFKSFNAKIRSMNQLTVQNALAMMEAIEKSSLDNERKKDLLDCVDGITCTEGTTKVVQACQTVNQLSKYLSTQDWTDMNALATDSDVLSLVARRMKLMGLNSLREDTKKQVVQILLHWRQKKQLQVPGPMECYNYAGAFQTMWKQLQVDGLVPPRRMYPVNPLDLGKTWLSNVYGSSDAPALVEVSGLSCPVRSTHTAIRQKSSQVTQVSTPQGPEWGMQAFMQMLMQRYEEKWQVPSHRAPLALAPPPMQSLAVPTAPATGMSNPTAPSNAVSTPTAPSDANPVPLPAPETNQTVELPVSHGESPEEQAPKATPPSDLETFEKKAYAALSDKNKGRAAAKAKASVKASAKATANAAAKASAKATAKVTANATAKASAKATLSAKPLNESKIQWVPQSGCFGCTRCRGNPKGCSQCWKELFFGK